MGISSSSSFSMRTLDLVVDSVIRCCCSKTGAYPSEKVRGMWGLSPSSSSSLLSKGRGDRRLGRDVRRWEVSRREGEDDGGEDEAGE